MLTVPIDVERCGPEAVKFYKSMIAKGESPSIALMCATRKSAELETATNHYVGMRPWYESVGKMNAKQVLAQAKAAGIQVGEHSRYNGTFADSRGGGDPGAWVHNGESHDKLRRTAEERGGVCEDLRTGNNDRIHELEAKREEAIGKRRKATSDKRMKMIENSRKKREPHPDPQSNWAQGLA